jgi:hypothetical protein
MKFSPVLLYVFPLMPNYLCQQSILAQSQPVFFIHVRHSVSRLCRATGKIVALLSSVLVFFQTTAGNKKHCGTNGGMHTLCALTLLRYRHICHRRAESETDVLAIKLAALRNVHLVQLNPIVTKPDISFEALSPAAIKSAVFCHVTSC